MNYSFRLKEGRKTIPLVVFEDSRYALAGEFLLAERSFLKAITALLQSGESGELSGNVFTLTVSGDESTVYNEETDSTLTLPTEELSQLTADYYEEVRRLRKRK